MSDMPPMTPAAPPPPPGAGLPWEEPNAGLGSIVPTVAGFVTRPIESYARMSLTVDLVRPIAYFVIIALAGACISQLWSFLLFDSILNVVRTVLGSQFEKFAPMIQRPGALQLVLGLVITPLVTLIVLFIWSGLMHLVLTLLGGANRGFAATLRVMCYAKTAELAVLVPFVGGLISLVWGLILGIVGLAEAHKTDGWKAALAVLLPLLACCLCIILGAVAFGATLMQALQQGR